MTPAQRSARIRELISQYPEPWVIEKEPHDYKDGTKEFTHVRVGYTKSPAWAKGEKINIEIGSYLSPDLAELLVLLREAAFDLAPMASSPTSLPPQTGTDLYRPQTS